MSTQFNCQKHFYFKLFKQLYITIQFSVSTVSMPKTVQFQIIQLSTSTQFKCTYSLIVKNISISNYSVQSSSYSAEELILPYYLPIAGGRIIGFIPFPRVFVLCEMQSISSRVWTRVAVSISYDDNHYTAGTTVEITDLFMATGGW